MSERTIAAAIAVHRALGPGLLESIHERALLIELKMLGLTVRSQVDMPLEYRGQPLGIGLRLDLLIDERRIVEIKSVSKLDELHFRQLTTYLRIARLSRPDCSSTSMSRAWLRKSGIYLSDFDLRELR
ncbi:MAG TPA: GxxExxY protein, partial [Povalibacter sp.]